MQLTGLARPALIYQSHPADLLYSADNYCPHQQPTPQTRSAPILSNLGRGRKMEIK